MLEVKRVALDTLHCDPANPRAHDGRNLAAIVASLKEFGQVEPLVVQAGTGKVIGGNGRLQALRGMGQSEAEMVTSCMYGAMRESAAARAELMGLANG